MQLPVKLVVSLGAVLWLSAAPVMAFPSRDDPVTASHDSRSRSRETVSERRLAEISSLESSCFEEINRQREVRGLRRFKFSSSLFTVARDYSRRMAEEGFFAHTDPEGRAVNHRVNEAGIDWEALAENLAYSNGYINPVAATLRAWMDSPGHRRNILDSDYRQSAIGVWISNDGTVYFTEIFLR